MEQNPTLYKELLESGVHFGHLKRKWNPKMLPYIFGEKKGIHIIDLNKTIEHLNECASALKSIAKSGKKILFVATKKQAKLIVEEEAQRVNMPYVSERWLGGMLTNFSTIRKSIKKMNQMEKMLNDGTLSSLTKKERLQMTRDKDKIEKVLGGISQMTRVPQAVLLIDIGHEEIALAEAKKLNITSFGLVDTNCNPNHVDFFIPTNDDSTKAIKFVISYLTNAIAEGLQEREALKLESKEEDSEASNLDTDTMDNVDESNVDEDESNETKKTSKVKVAKKDTSTTRKRIVTKSTKSTPTKSDK